MITLPIRYLRTLHLAVASLRKARAVAANMYRHVQIGTGEDAKIYDMAFELEKKLTDLLEVARNEKAKVFSIDVYVPAGLPDTERAKRVSEGGGDGASTGDADRADTGSP